MSRNNNSLSRELRTQAAILGSFVAIFWVLEIADQLIFHRALDGYGIIPHSLIGLRGILFAPFLHGGFGHLIANTIPFIILGWLVMIQETSDFWIVTLVTMLIGGLGVWLFAAPGSVHIGASILIFGYLGFLLARGYFQRNLASIVISVLVFLMYSPLIWGILPSSQGISWQGHLFGFLGGVITARLIAREKQYYR
ncbi:rhomboid family intramembrane serine protease [Gloeothece verrucosa]|uniref:Rhomboid family protein n=1 Tax=Gloeothece verrucosa (strain PCC 7822) TaxID=497965 RepID=E0UKA2_GLOV7|nr:rhomboid family intramembrane serine protease [Gloeothece verrucosa]ADN15864.1 Rhomboid family protein [Gloeothece verrucosa PCC 7822]